MDQKEIDRQAVARRMVEREVHYCVSGLVATLANGYGSQERGDLGDLTEQAFELSSPVADYESAAMDENWRQDDDGQIRRADRPVDCDTGEEPEYDSWQDCCEGENIEPHDNEVYEHWIVSTWLAHRLRNAGEKVDDDFAGLTIWARTCTGQAICLDHVIQQIAVAAAGPVE